MSWRPFRPKYLNQQPQRSSFVGHLQNPAPTFCGSNTTRYPVTTAPRYPASVPRHPASNPRHQAPRNSVPPPRHPASAAKHHVSAAPTYPAPDPSYPALGLRHPASTPRHRASTERHFASHSSNLTYAPPSAKQPTSILKQPVPNIQRNPPSIRPSIQAAVSTRYPYDQHDSFGHPPEERYERRVEYAQQEPLFPARGEPPPANDTLQRAAPAKEYDRNYYSERPRKPTVSNVIDYHHKHATTGEPQRTVDKRPFESHRRFIMDDEIHTESYEKVPAAVLLNRNGRYSAYKTAMDSQRSKRPYPFQEPNNESKRPSTIGNSSESTIFNVISEKLRDKPDIDEAKIASILDTILSSERVQSENNFNSLQSRIYENHNKTQSKITKAAEPVGESNKLKFVVQNRRTKIPPLVPTDRQSAINVETVAAEMFLQDKRTNIAEMSFTAKILEEKQRALKKKQEASMYNVIALDDSHSSRSSSSSSSVRHRKRSKRKHKKNKRKKKKERHRSRSRSSSRRHHSSKRNRSKNRKYRSSSSDSSSSSDRSSSRRKKHSKEKHFQISSNDEIKSNNYHFDDRNDQNNQNSGYNNKSAIGGGWLNDNRPHYDRSKERCSNSRSQERYDSGRSQDRYTSSSSRSHNRYSMHKSQQRYGKDRYPNDSYPNDRFPRDRFDSKPHQERFQNDRNERYTRENYLKERDSGSRSSRGNGESRDQRKHLYDSRRSPKQMPPPVVTVLPPAAIIATPMFSPLGAHPILQPVHPPPASNSLSGLFNLFQRNLNRISGQIDVSQIRQRSPERTKKKVKESTKLEVKYLLEDLVDIVCLKFRKEEHAQSHRLDHEIAIVATTSVQDIKCIELTGITYECEETMRDVVGVVDDVFTVVDQIVHIVSLKSQNDECSIDEEVCETKIDEAESVECGLKIQAAIVDEPASPKQQELPTEATDKPSNDKSTVDFPVEVLSDDESRYSSDTESSFSCRSDNSIVVNKDDVILIDESDAGINNCDNSFAFKDFLETLVDKVCDELSQEEKSTIIVLD